MGHPDFYLELESIRAISQDRDGKFAAVVEELERQVEADVKRQSGEFVEKLEYVTDVLIACLNQFPLVSDINRPVEEVVDDSTPSLQSLLIQRQEKMKNDGDAVDEASESKKSTRPGTAKSNYNPSELKIAAINLTGLDFPHEIKSCILMH
jgi:hypothetical protein